MIIRLVLIFAYSACLLTAQTGFAAKPLASRIPAEFPTFTVPGHDDSMAALRSLYFHHYDPNPKATLWDEWLLQPAIWPASGADQAVAAWREGLRNRGIDSEGYVFTNQHASIAHQTGWPFPSWNQSSTGFGWHFSYENTIGEPWRPNWIAKIEDWGTSGVQSAGLNKSGWDLLTSASRVAVSSPAFQGRAFEAPYIQLRWKADLPSTATPYLEWIRSDATDYAADRRFYFEPPSNGKMTYTMIPVYQHPEWKETITGLRLNFEGLATSTPITIQALFAQYDTRHNINNPSYVTACIDYFSWTGDLNFLRDNIEKMRLAMRYMETEFGTDVNGIVTTLWVGHEGRSGVSRNVDGSKKLKNGEGVGNNYWDLLPFGQQDSYATIRHYGATLKMASMEKAIADNPGWNIPKSPLMRTADHWTSQAKAAKENGNRIFWNNETGRFTLGIDADSKQADYGFTFLNLEAISYDFATEEHAREIMAWISGKRTVASDTAQTTDIYHWRFAPRATTLRNTDHYMWVWNGAADIPFGGQVQDGGAVLGFSYHDIMARLKTLGPADAATRLEEIAAWFKEVESEGGYRAYYDGKKREGTLQGGGTAGGLGMDQEFFESVMVPQVLLEGFAGFKPTPTGFTLQPDLPANWPLLTIENVQYRNMVLRLEVSSKLVTIKEKGRMKVHNYPIAEPGTRVAFDMDDGFTLE